MLDSPWKIAALVAVLILFRALIGAWKEAPHRAFLVELSNSALIAFALVFLLIRPYLLQAFYIPSGSMEPTLHEPANLPKRAGDRILVNKFVYRLGLPRRGDIIVFKAPPQAQQGNVAADGRFINGSPDFIKRVIGLPGDHIRIIANAGVEVNGKILDEPYLPVQGADGRYYVYGKPLEQSYLDGKFGQAAYDWPTDADEYVVPEGHLFVLGDNRNNSHDSHAWRNPQTDASQPELPLENVHGRALFIWFPADRFGRLTR